MSNVEMSAQNKHSIEPFRAAVRKYKIQISAVKLIEIMLTPFEPIVHNNLEFASYL